MANEILPTAWLESEDGQKWPIIGNCSLGRSSSNLVVLKDGEVSRRHSLIHAQEQDEYWLVDLGSVNGTYLNNHRVIQPTRLRENDVISIGVFVLVFHQPNCPETGHPSIDSSKPTIAVTKSFECWLLLADIIESHKLIQSCPMEELAQEWGKWLSECKQVIQENNGRINKYLGDGFLAYWYQDPSSTGHVIQAIQKLKRIQTNHSPSFRLVLHFGTVGVGGGVASMGEDNLMGREVYFVFRMENQAKTTGIDCLASAGAEEKSRNLISMKPVSREYLKGFTEKNQFFQF